MTPKEIIRRSYWLQAFSCICGLFSLWFAYYDWQREWYWLCAFQAICVAVHIVCIEVQTRCRHRMRVLLTWIERAQR